MSSTISVTIDPAAPVVANVQPPSRLDVNGRIAQGLPGPRGLQGDPGAPGIPGPLASSFTHPQSSASALWIIVHNLNRYPSVTVVDSTGRVVEGDPDYIDGNSLTISFSAPFSGTAYLN